MLNVNLLLVLTEERFHRVWLKHVGGAVCTPLTASST